MTINEDFKRIANQLLRYIALKKPKEGVYENTEEVATAFLMSLMEHPTYVFDYRDLKIDLDQEDAISHVQDLAEENQEPVNFLCRIIFPPNSPIRNVLYLTVAAKGLRAPGGGNAYGHLTIPDIVDKYKSEQNLDITPRCLGLTTILRVDDKQTINIDLCTINNALQEEYRGIEGAVNYMELYHRTLFMMSYALHKSNHALMGGTVQLPPDDTGMQPVVNYYQVHTFDQTAQTLNPDQIH